MKIQDLKNELLKNNPNLVLESKRDLAFQVAKHIEEARLVKGYTQKELAHKASTSQSNIARAENGNSLPSLSFLKRLAIAFNTYIIPPKFAFMEEANNFAYGLNTQKSEHMVSTPYIAPNFLYASFSFVSAQGKNYGKVLA